MKIEIIPATDIIGGACVRLTQGDYSRMTVYGEDPCAQAREFLAAVSYTHLTLPTKLEV